MLKALVRILEILEDIGIAALIIPALGIYFFWDEIFVFLIYAVPSVIGLFLVVKLFQYIKKNREKSSKKKRMLDNLLTQKINEGASVEEIETLIKQGAEIKGDLHNINGLLRYYAQQTFGITVLKLLLDHGADVEAKGDEGDSALMHAALKGQKEIIQLLLERGADTGAKEKNGINSLMLVAREGHKEIVQLLLERGADIEAKDNDGVNALKYAVLGEHKEIVQLLLERGADIEARDNEKETVLASAAINGRIEMVQLLLEKGADVEANFGDWTALMGVSFQGYKEIAQLLLEKGADIEAKGEDGVTPLLIASQQGQKEIVQLLLEHGADIETKNDKGWTSLKNAASQGHKEVVQLLLKYGADIEAKDNKEGWTPLMNAAHQGYKETVQVLLERGADIEAKDNEGWTPLIFAAGEGHKEVVQLLLEHKANIEVKDNEGWTPLMNAADQGHKESVQLLLKHGASLDINDTTTVGNVISALFGEKYNNILKAAENGHKESVQLLLKYGADVETKDDQGWTPLIFAAGEGHKEVVQLLLKYGAKTETANNEGWVPLLVATHNDHKEIVQLLLEYEADIEAKNNKGWTPLISASFRDHKKITQLLLEHGADTEARDNEKGQTPLMNAAERGYKKIVQLLLEYGADIEAKDYIWGDTALALALENKHIDIATLLIQHNATVDLNVEITSAVNGVSEILDSIVSKNKNKIFTTTVDTINLNDTNNNILLTINDIDKDVSKDLLGVTIEYTASNRIDNWESKVDFITQTLKIDSTKTSIELFSNIVDNKYGIRFYTSSPEAKLVSTLKISGEKPKFIKPIEKDHASILLFEQIPGIEIDEWTRNQRLIEDILQMTVEIEECDDTHELYSEDFNVHTFIMIKETAISIMPKALNISGQYRKSAINEGYKEYYFKNVTDPERWKENKDKIIDYIDKRVSIIENGTNIILRETVEETIPKLLNLEDSHKNYPKLYAVKEDGPNKTYYYTFLPEIDLNTWKENSKRISFRTLFNEPNKVYKLETYEKLNTKIYDEDFYKGQLIALHEFAEIPTANDLMSKNIDLTKEFKENKIFWGYQAGAKAYYTDINELSHTMIIGGSGSGKSNLMNGVILSLLNSADKVKKIYLLDLKEGCPEFGMYRNLDSEKITVFSDQTSPIAVRDALYEIEAEMIVRSHYIADQGGKIKKMTYDPIYIIIDEYAQIELMHADGSEENNAKNQINDILLRIGSKARSTNIKLIVQTQDPNSVGNDLKRHLQSRVLLKTFNHSDAAATLIMPDFLEEQGLNHMAFSAGRFVFEDNNSNNTIQTELQFPFVDPEKEQYLNYKSKAQTNTSTDDTIFDKYKEGVAKKAKYLAHTKLLSGFSEQPNQDDHLLKDGNYDELEVLNDDTDVALDAFLSDVDELSALYGA